MSVYLNGDEYICYHCYLEACDEAEEVGHSEYFNKEQDPYYYPILLVSKPKDAPDECHGNYCNAYLEWD